MKISTAQFMRECVETPTVYLGTIHKCYDANEFESAVNWDMFPDAPRRKAVKKSYGLDFIREDGEHSRFTSAHTNVEKFIFSNYVTGYRVDCINKDTGEPWTHIYYLA